MRIASPAVEWTALPAKGTEMPKEWGRFLTDDVLQLKDTRSKYWRNRLTKPNTFVYVFPKKSRRDWEQTLITRIGKRVRRELAPLAVHLFAACGARNEFYGEWLVEEKGDSSEVQDALSLTLKRLDSQTESLIVQYAIPDATAVAHRSINEQEHHSMLDACFPSEQGWIVRHEPETLLLDLHEPTVVDGRMRAGDAGKSYTCDFVVARGFMRFCIESKPCEEKVTPDALAKARALRDRTLSRVLLLVGKGACQARLLDLGSPGDKTILWHEDAVDFFKRMG